MCIPNSIWKLNIQCPTGTVFQMYINAMGIKKIHSFLNNKKIRCGQLFAIIILYLSGQQILKTQTITWKPLKNFEVTIKSLGTMTQCPFSYLFIKNLKERIMIYSFVMMAMIMMMIWRTEVQIY